MNRMYEVGEGRPVWKLRPAMLVVTFVLVVLAAVALLDWWSRVRSRNPWVKPSAWARRS
jgi:uncharacterized BrkB/YihY/UPF0761 family membrane protein